jgi:hypothetical protein
MTVRTSIRASEAKPSAEGIAPRQTSAETNPKFPTPATAPSNGYRDSAGMVVGSTEAATGRDPAPGDDAQPPHTIAVIDTPKIKRQTCIRPSLRLAAPLAGRLQPRSGARATTHSNPFIDPMPRRLR